MEQAVIDLGEFKFKFQHQHLVVPRFQMTSQQQEHHLSKVSSESLKENKSTIVAVSLTDLCETPDNVSLSISLNDVNIPCLSKEVLERMWHKAEHLLSIPGQVVEAPFQVHPALNAM